MNALAKGGIIIALVLLFALGGLLYSRGAARGIVLNLDDGIMTCGFKPLQPTPLSSGEEREFRDEELILRAQGRVLFSGRVDRINCYRDPEGRRGFPGGDAILVAFPAAQLEATLERWGRVFRQLGAGQEELQVLDSWAAEVTQTERAGRSSRDVWLQHSWPIPGTNMGVYVQSIPAGSELPLVYGAHFTVFWEEPGARH
jgi:hypothetical protein